MFLTDENEKNVSLEQETKSPTEENYLEIIKNYKENSVSKEEYEKVIQENKNLLNQYIEGNQMEDKKGEVDVDTNELRKKLFDVESPLSNLEYAETALKLRDQVIKETGRDPFLPYGQNISPTDEDVKKANNVAEVFRHCIEYANGDDEVFTNELMRLTDDAMPMAGRKKR